MTATAVDRNTPVLYPQRQTSVPIATSAVIPAGVLVAEQASDGKAVNAADTAGHRVVGRSEHAASQTAGDTHMVCGQGVYGFGATAALISAGQAHCGKTVYVKDNQTVGLDTDTTNAIPVGTLVQIEGAVFFVSVGLGRLGLQSDSGFAVSPVDDAAVDPAVADLGTMTVIPILIPDAVGADYDYIVPEKIEIIDIVCIKDGAGAANTYTAKNGAGAAISNAIVAAVDKTVSRAGTLDKATRVLAALATLRFTVVRNAGSSACAIFVYGILRP